MGRDKILKTANRRANGNLAKVVDHDESEKRVSFSLKEGRHTMAIETSSGGAQELQDESADINNGNGNAIFAGDAPLLESSASARSMTGGEEGIKVMLTHSNVVINTLLEFDSGF